jgi:predicted deacylase
MIDTGPALRRVIGACGGETPGPLVVCVAGIHGNEPAGVHALRRLFAMLARQRPPLRGRFVGLAGNLGALHAGIRYRDEDLNRVWTPERIDALRRGEHGTQGPEAREQLELLEALDSELGRAEGPVHFLDLHTTSAAGQPFACIGDTLRNRDFALRLPVPILLGIEEQLDGALLEYLGERGAVTLGFEAGQHAAPSSVEHHEALAGLALAEAGCLDESHLPEAQAWRRHLEAATAGTPRVLEIRHRHPVAPEDGFHMEPGFRNFQRVRRGQLLARDRRGEIRSPESAMVVLPLYQKKGDDGFFLARPVRPLWLRLSRVLRRLGLERLAPLLPGVRRHPTRAEALLVETGVARFLARQVFHLLGYRKLRSEHGCMLVARRREH